jgi:hypothetical protein
MDATLVSPRGSPKDSFLGSLNPDTTSTFDETNTTDRMFELNESGRNDMFKPSAKILNMYISTTATVLLEEH